MDTRYKKIKKAKNETEKIAKKKMDVHSMAKESKKWPKKKSWRLKLLFSYSFHVTGHIVNRFFPSKYSPSYASVGSSRVLILRKLLHININFLT